MYPIGVILYSWPVANKNQAIEKDEKREEGREEERERVKDKGWSDEAVLLKKKKILVVRFIFL